MPLIEGHVFADYEIVAKLGQGGMGAVYQARQPVLKRLVALKVLAPALAADEAFIKRFQSEAAAAANLSHTNIVQVYAAGNSEGIHFIAMEHIEGQTLGALLDERGRLDPDLALEICYHVALALDHGWTKAQLIHRDIKPDNIFIATSGVTKLGDFGLAKSVIGDGNKTLTGIPMGSPHYISPEQARGERDIDFRTDIYSLGCTLYHMLTGQRVYEGEQAISAILKHVHEPPPSLLEFSSDCPPDLAALVSRMLAKNKEDRHQSYDELLTEILAIRQQLEQAAAGAPSEPRPLQPGQRAPAAAASSRGRKFLAFALLLAVLGGLGWWGYAWWQAGTLIESQPEDPAAVNKFISEVDSQPPDKQVEQVMEKLRKINPGFDGKEKYSVENDAVIELSFSSVNVVKLWPIAALRDLKKLVCDGDAQTRLQSNLSDLSPLRALSLTELDISWTKVQSLEPLRDMALKVLRCSATRVNDLSPLKGMLLEELDCSHTPVKDLTPLKDMPLVSLNCADTDLPTGPSLRESSLAPLRDMPLKTLKCELTSLRDLEVLRSLKHLEELNGKNPLEMSRYMKRPDELKKQPGDRLPPGAGRAASERPK